MNIGYGELMGISYGELQQVSYKQQKWLQFREWLVSLARGLVEGCSGARCSEGN